MRTVARRAANKAIGLRPGHTNPFATHLPVLVGLGSLIPVRSVVEFGSGEFSTSLFLDRRAFPGVESVVSFEDDRAWAARIDQKLGAEPRLDLRAVGSVPDAVPSDGLPADLVFVDDSVHPDSRARTLSSVGRAVAQHSVVVVHDFEQWQYWRPARQFRRRYRMRALTPQVGVLWNDADLDRAALADLDRRIESHDHRSPDDIEFWSGALA